MFVILILLIGSLIVDSLIIKLLLLAILVIYYLAYYNYVDCSNKEEVKEIEEVEAEVAEEKRVDGDSLALKQMKEEEQIYKKTNLIKMTNQLQNEQKHNKTSIQIKLRKTPETIRNFYEEELKKTDKIWWERDNTNDPINENLEGLVNF